MYMYIVEHIYSLLKWYTIFIESIQFYNLLYLNSMQEIIVKWKELLNFK